MSRFTPGQDSHMSGPGYVARLGSSYNFPLRVDRASFFASLLEEEIRWRREALGSLSIRVLDVGCGEGLGGAAEHLRSLSRQIDEYWGLEPDPGVTMPAGVAAATGIDAMTHATGRPG